jgi:hypothetical protein
LTKLQILRNHIVRRLLDDLSELSELDFLNSYKLNKSCFNSTNNTRKWLADELREFRNINKKIKDLPDTEFPKKHILNYVYYNLEFFENQLTENLLLLANPTNAR